MSPDGESSGADFFGASADPSFVVGFDGSIQEINPAALLCLGFSFREISGASFLGFIDSAQRPSIYKIFQQLVAHGRSQRFQARLKGKDGLGKGLEFCAVGVADRKCICLVGREILARTFAEDELERLRNEYEAVLNAVSEGVHWIGPDGRILFENPAAARMLGYEIAELIGKPAHQVMHHHRADGSIYPVEECPAYATLHDGITRHVTNEVFWRKDGTSFAVEFTSTGTRDRLGRPNGSVVTFTDATARKKFEAAIQAARLAAEATSRAKSEFLGNMSHEFRTPLNGVIGLSEQLLGSSLDPEQRSCANMIRISGESLLIMANNMLDLSKIESGRLTLETVDFDVREVINQAIELFTVQAQNKGLNLVLQVTSEVPCHVRGDSGRLRQVLVNLLGNAVKFTSRGEVVLAVSAVIESSSDITLRFEVRDTGIGIQPEALRKLFEAFNQADNSNTRKYGGGGLGLAISKRLIELMKGKIEVESVPGKGSQFAFEVQLGRKPELIEVAVHRQLQSLHVLIVSDNVADRETLTDYTKAWGMRSTHALNSEEAMMMLRKSVVDDPFELVVLDFNSPGSKGISLARAIRMEPLLKSVKVVMTATTENEPDPIVVKAAAIGCIAYKPLQRESLLAQLIDVMSGTVSQRTKQIAVSGSLPKRYREIRTRKEIKILLAEDNRINQMVFLGVLQKLGYGASLANNGVEVLNAMNKDEYDLIFMDCQMPEMDGYEATRQIRAGKWRQPKIVAITANIMHGDDETCRGAGMDDYMAKPVRIEKLREMINRWLPDGAVEA